MTSSSRSSLGSGTTARGGAVDVGVRAIVVLVVGVTCWASSRLSPSWSTRRTGPAMEGSGPFVAVLSPSPVAGAAVLLAVEVLLAVLVPSLVPLIFVPLSFEVEVSLFAVLFVVDAPATAVSCSPLVSCSASPISTVTSPDPSASGSPSPRASSTTSACSSVTPATSAPRRSVVSTSPTRIESSPVPFGDPLVSLRPSPALVNTTANTMSNGNAIAISAAR